ncbi:MAG TPA: L-threonylcarbamoyladenylate synthase [bacterium]|nr:L-threonylcarbamoyladenylate synthase [bacterium]
MLKGHPPRPLQVIGVHPASQDVPRQALRILLDGGLVAFPTDTYYALGAAALDGEAVARVFATKRRPHTEPLPVFVADTGQWRMLVPDLPEIALRLAERFWPGPLTIVCRRAPHLPPLLAGGGETIAVRQPGSVIAVALCRALGMPITGTSANTHGVPAPVTAIEVGMDLGGSVDLILDGGACPGGHPSTVVDVTRTPPVIVRAGGVTLEELREVIGPLAAPAAPAPSADGKAAAQDVPRAG